MSFGRGNRPFGKKLVYAKKKKKRSKQKKERMKVKFILIFCLVWECVLSVESIYGLRKG